jgi:hypothetical protein
MQLTLGRRWILELNFNIAFRKRVDGACCAMRTSIQRPRHQRGALQRWDRDKSLGIMLSGWDRTLGGPGDRRM